jgi:hypothetical protein
MSTIGSELAFVNLEPKACQAVCGSTPGTPGTSTPSDGPDAAMTNK